MRPQPTPLFNRAELASAISLLLPEAEAVALAERWFAQFAESVDHEGRYIHPYSWGDPRPVESQAAVVEPMEWHAGEVVARDEATFEGWTMRDIDPWIMRLGDLHLSLVALVNDETYERMRRVRFMTNAGAARNRLQLRRAVHAYRR